MFYQKNPTLRKRNKHQKFANFISNFFFDFSTDRLNTDILFGKRNNFQTLLVETGVHKLDKVQEIIEELDASGVKNEDLENQIPDFYLAKLGDLLDNLET